MFRYSCTEKARFKVKPVFVMMQEYYAWSIHKGLHEANASHGWPYSSVSKELSETLNTAEIPKTFCCNILLLGDSSEKEENRTMPQETFILINTYLHYPRNTVTSVVVNSRTGKKILPTQSSEKSVTQSVSILLWFVWGFFNILVADLVLSRNLKQHTETHILLSGLWSGLQISLVDARQVLPPRI